MPAFPLIVDMLVACFFCREAIGDPAPLTEEAYAIFPTAVSKCLHVGHSKVRSS